MSTKVIRKSFCLLLNLFLLLHDTTISESPIVSSLCPTVSGDCLGSSRTLIFHLETHGFSLVTVTQETSLLKQNLLVHRRITPCKPRNSLEIRNYSLTPGSQLKLRWFKYSVLTVENFTFEKQKNFLWREVSLSVMDKDQTLDGLRFDPQKFFINEEIDSELPHQGPFFISGTFQGFSSTLRLRIYIFYYFI